MMTLPSEFVERMAALLGDGFPCLRSALQTDAPASIRINRPKGMAVPEERERVPWCETGYYLPERLSFTFDPLFHAGGYYVQEASSMFLEQAVRMYVQEPVVCLDLCAAPGGKSTLLADVLPQGSLLVSNEVIRSRSNILAENLAKWGNPAHVVTHNDPAEIGCLTHLFDVIVTDVPCSGEGMFRKDAASMGEWSVDNVQLCAARQRRILHDVWEALKPGGIWIYSTCTYNTDENEENVHRLAGELGAEVLPLPVDASWNITGSLRFDSPVYRFFPHKTKGEGFFLAVLRKAEGESQTVRFRPERKKGKQASAPVVPAAVNHWLLEPEEYKLEMRNETIRAVAVCHWDVYQLLSARLRIVTAGVCVGECKGKDVVPAHGLALSAALNRDAFPQVEVSWEEAIRYLRKETMSLPPDQTKGYVLVTYKGLSLGFVKQLGNRANNLYPQEWRIRTSYIPEKVQTLER